MIYKPTPDEIKAILEQHRKWLNDEKEGKRAVLQGADLQGADLQGADLQGADLQGADLQGADLQGADIRGADLQGADIRGADLRGAYLQAAYLQAADLRGADLRGADLQGANLQGADLRYQVCPEEGEFIAWKKVNIQGESYILKLKIPAEAKRLTTLSSRKCRAESAIPIEAFTLSGDSTTAKCFHSNNVSDFVYTIGESAIPDSYDDDVRIECSHGISFFITRKEAIDF